MIVFHVHHSVAQEALRLRCVRSFSTKKDCHSYRCENLKVHTVSISNCTIRVITIYSLFFCSNLAGEKCFCV
jgi:hypothetical protein